MLIAEISAMLPGETLTYYTESRGDVYLHDKIRAVPGGDEYTEHAQRSAPGAGAVMSTLVLAPDESYTVVDCTAYSTYTTQTYTSNTEES